MAGTTTPRIRLGFIGCGNHASGSLFPALAQVEEIEWAAVCDLDWVMPPLVKDILSRGFPVFMEKPIAISVEAAAELVEAARQAGKPAFMATMWRHAPAYVRAREIMSKSDFGAPTHLEGRFCAPGPRERLEKPPIDAPWRYCLYQGVHLIDATRALCGDIESVSAHLNGDEREFRSFAISLRFVSGATGSLTMACSAVLTTHHRVVGTTGATVMVENLRDLTSISVPHWTGEKPGYRGLATRTWNAGVADDYCRNPGYVEEFRYFAQCLLKGESPRANFEDGLAGLKTLQAIYDSARQSGSAVRV